MKWVKQTKSIHERPKDILTRDTIGHLECDRIVGKRNEPHKNVVLIDLALRYARLGWLPAAAVVARHRAGRQHDDTGISILSLTTDQGCEFSALPAFLPDCLYACDPEKPTQTGQVGYMNKLTRQYIPKGISLRNITEANLDWIANELNTGPKNGLAGSAPPSCYSTWPPHRFVERQPSKMPETARRLAFFV